MPYIIIKNKTLKGYAVINAYTGKIYSYNTTLKNAIRQVSLLNKLDR